MVSVRLRRTAENDLVDIGLESRASWGQAQMERTLRELDEAFHLLAATPRLGRQCDDIKQGYRRLKVRSPLIYYRLDAAHEVDIVRILHGKMDPTLHLRIGFVD